MGLTGGQVRMHTAPHSGRDAPVGLGAAGSSAPGPRP